MRTHRGTWTVASLLTGLLGVVNTGAMGAPAQIAGAASALHSEAEDYTDLGVVDASIPRGLSTWTLKLEEEHTGGQISVWHRSEAGCRGFDIVGVKAKAATDGAEWRSLKPTNWQGVTHFLAEGMFNEIEMTVSNSRLLTQECQIVVRLANFSIPDIVTMLAKINAPACDGTDTPVCTYSAERIDTAERPTISLTEADYKKFALEPQAIYKFKGYELQTDDVTVFRLLTSQKVLE